MDNLHKLVKFAGPFSLLLMIGFSNQAPGQFISEDKHMTAKVQQKSMTRTARKAKLDELISMIEKEERKKVEQSSQAQQKSVHDQNIRNMTHRIGMIRQIR